MINPRWLALIALTLSVTVNAADRQVRSPSMLANTCAGCHGTNGASAGAYMPTIGGLDKDYLYSVMNDYQSGLRPSTIMGRIMRGYDDQEIWAIASFFAAQPWVSTDRVADASQVHQGREIHASKCKTCHEDGGREQDHESPRLAGQWADYTRYALEVCREEGKRCNPRKMGVRVMELSDADLEALARFYESEK